MGKLRSDEDAKQSAILLTQAKAAADLEFQIKRDKFTLSALMSLYSDYLAKQGKTTTSRDVVSLSKHLSTLASKPAAEVTKNDLVKIQRSLLDDGKGRTANKLRSFVRAAYGC